MKTIKQVLLVLFSAILMVGMTLAGMSSLKVDASTTVSWNFKNSSFKNLGTISSTTTVDGLTLVATDSFTMQVKVKDATFSGTDVIKVSFQSASSTDTRILIVTDSAGN